MFPTSLPYVYGSRGRNNGAMVQSMDFDLEGVKQGGKADWDRFVRFAAPVIHSAVKRSGGAILGAEAAADLVQDVFVRLCRERFRLLKTYAPERASLATWLALVARSVTLDALRRRRPDTITLDDLVQEPAAPEPREDRPLTLPPGLLSGRQELVLRLLYERDMKVAEAAALLGVQAQTLRSTRHKALARLRRYRLEQAD